MSEIENNQINFSNILLQEESYFFDNSLEFEINDLIYENTENDKQSDSNSNSDIEEMVIYNKQIPKIFPNTKQAGSLVDSDLLRFDFYANNLLTTEQIRDIENNINQTIFKAFPVDLIETSFEE
jgi:hypothetical protein